MPLCRWLLASLLVLGSLTAGAESRRIGAAGADVPTGRFLVGLREPAGDPRRRAAAADALAPDRGTALAQRLRMPAAVRALGPDLVNLVGPPGMSGQEEADWLATLAADPEVAFVEVDRRRRAHAMASDPLYIEQWYLQSTDVAAARFDTAWDTTTAAGAVVAILDTGIRYEHPDLGRASEGGRLLPGRDFVSGENSSSFRVANDGDGWDDDASDPGDWLSDADLATSLFSGCSEDGPDPDLLPDEQPSSWHGTRVAGMIGARSNNGIGIAGSTWAGGILPVRVLGKCGGYDSDIIAGMRWSAGLAVGGVPANPNPARILNMSLGGVGTCTQGYRNVLTDLTAAGVLVVASAGNVPEIPVEVPANCPGVLAVAGLRHVGSKVGYSALGPEVGIAAPGGNCINLVGPCLFSLTTTTNLGEEDPAGNGYTDQFNANIGTSFASPVVSGIAGLMRTVNPALLPAEITARIRSGALPFPAPDPALPTCPFLEPLSGQCNCTTTTCGAGIANAPGALAEARRPIARIATPPSVAAGTTVTLDGTDSRAAAGATLASYAWTVDGNPPGVSIGNPASATASIVAPANSVATVRLTVTDDGGRTDSRTLTVGGTAGAAGGGGGGGFIHPAVLAALLASRRRRPQR